MRLKKTNPSNTFSTSAVLISSTLASRSSTKWTTSPPALKKCRWLNEGSCLKAKHFIICLAATSLAIWWIWSLAYHHGFNRGYFKGTQDEFLCWKQEPARLENS